MAGNRNSGLIRPDLENLLEGCQIIGFDWRYVYLNKTAQTHNNIPNKELLGKKYDEVWPGIDKTEVYRLIKNCLEERRAHRLENEFIYPDGKTGWFDLSIQPVPEGVFILSIDITEQKLLTRELYLREEHFHSLFEQATDGIFIADENGNYTDVNKAGCDMLAYSKAEIIQLNIVDIITADEIPRVKPAIEELLLAKITKQEWKFKRKNNTVFLGEVTTRLLPSGHLQAYLRDITNLKMSEIALFESERKFKNLVSDMQVGVVIQGPVSEVLLSNPKALELLGLTEEQFLGKTSFDPDWNVIHEDGSDFPGPTHPVARSIITRKPVRDVIMGVYRPVHADRMWLLVDALPQLNPDGSIRQVICTFIDINKRKEAEAALRKSEDLFNKAFHGSPSPMTIATQKDGIYIAVNDSFLRLIELTREEVIGKTGLQLELIDEQSRSKIRSVLKEKGTLHDIEIRAKSSTGRQLYLLTSIENTNLAGEPCTIVTMLDITERKLAEEALRQSESKFRKIYEAGPFGMAMVNSEFKIINANNTFCQIMGYSEEELCSMTFRDITYKTIDNEVLFIRKLIRGEIPVFKTEKQYLRKDGKIIWGSLTVTANFSHDGKFLHNLAIVEDISARKHAEEDIKSMNETLEQRVVERTTQLQTVNKELEAFSYSVSHDLRAPLRSINGFTQILIEEYSPKLDSEGLRICNVIQQSSKKMGLLIDELLAFSRLNRSEMNFSLIKMKDLISAVYDEFIDNGFAKKIEFNVGNICDSEGDSHLIKQVWTNLLSNAIKYSSKKDVIKIDISCIPSDGFNTYCIKDNGVGFDMAFKDKLFGVFQRLHSFADFEGTGVGLAIVQRIVTRHGGEVWAKSEVEKGAEFYFTLPGKQKISIK